MTQFRSACATLEKRIKNAGRKPSASGSRTGKEEAANVTSIDPKGAMRKYEPHDDVAKGKYETNVLPHLDKITAWAEAGASKKEIAEKLHITYSTFRKYLDDGEKGDERYAALSAALARACVIADSNVEAANYKLATGYTVELQKTFKVRVVDYDKDTGRKIREHEELVTGIDQVYVPPNVQAQIFYLTNRMPDKWKRQPGESADESQGGGVVYLSPVLLEEAEEAGDG